MRYIANILTDEPFEGSEFYNITNDKDLIIKGIPTLIVGWEKVKELYPGTSIIEWKVKDGVYWTYGKYEKRDRYEENVKKFMDMTFKNCVESVRYVFFDVLLYGENKISGFIDTLRGNNVQIGTNVKTAYASDNMLYVYIETTGTVYGISLRDCDYIDETYKKRIFSAIYENQTIKLLKNSDDSIKKVRYKVRDRSYILPYLFTDNV